MSKMMKLSSKEESTIESRVFANEAEWAVSGICRQMKFFFQKLHHCRHAVAAVKKSMICLPSSSFRSGPRSDNSPEPVVTMARSIAPTLAMRAGSVGLPAFFS